MKTVFVFFAFIIAAMVASCQPAGAWEEEKIGVEGKIQEVKRIQWLREHSHTREPQYVFNDPQAIADREFQIAVNKLGEKYVGR